MKIFHLSTEAGVNARVPIGRTQPARKKPKARTAAGEETESQTIHRGDPSPEGDTVNEPDIQRLGMILTGATRGFRMPGGTTLVGDFQKILTKYTPTGEVKDKTPQPKKKANIDDVMPVKMGKRIPLAEAFSRFAFHNHYALRHEDGVQFDFLHKIAKDLAEKGEMASLGTGNKGNQPLIFADGGTAYNAFLYGECEGEKYKLLVLITRMEIKRPEQRGEREAPDASEPAPATDAATEA